MSDKPDRIIRMGGVQSITGMSRAFINRLRAEGKFIDAIALGERAIGFSEQETYRWVEERKAARQRAERMRQAFS